MIKELLARNAHYATTFQEGALPGKPGKGLAVVACMDARIMIADLLGIACGDAHVIRNAGGVVNQETLRSLIISTQLSGTREIIVISHTDCTMARASEGELLEHVRKQTGQQMDPLLFYTFTDLQAHLRWQVRKVKECPLLPQEIRVHGLIYDVARGRLTPVEDL